MYNQIDFVRKVTARSIEYGSFDLCFNTTNDDDVFSVKWNTKGQNDNNGYNNNERNRRLKKIQNKKKLDWPWNNNILSLFLSSSRLITVQHWPSSCYVRIIIIFSWIFVSSLSLSLHWTVSHWQWNEMKRTFNIKRMKQ